MHYNNILNFLTLKASDRYDTVRTNHNDSLLFSFSLYFYSSRATFLT